MCAPTLSFRERWAIEFLFNRIHWGRGDILILFLAIDSPISHSLMFQGLAANWGEAIGVKVKEDSTLLVWCVCVLELVTYFSLHFCLSVSLIYVLRGTKGRKEKPEPPEVQAQMLVTTIWNMLIFMPYFKYIVYAHASKIPSFRHVKIFQCLAAGAYSKNHERLCNLSHAHYVSVHIFSFYKDVRVFSFYIV